jgi:hypothetical protein
LAASLGLTSRPSANALLGAWSLQSMVLPGRIHRRVGRDMDRLRFLLQTFIDVFTKVSFAKLYYRKTPYHGG